MQSKFTDLSSFIATKWVPYNRHTREYMKWWAKEKKALKARATERAIKRAETKLSNKLEPSSEFLLWNITKAIELTRVKLEQMEEKWNINVRDLSTIRWMNRIQNWQPTTYVKEESDVNQNIRIEWIHIVMWGNAIDSSKNDKNNA
jgi:hypothetical protein